MRLFIQIEIGEWRRTDYDKPWLHYASSLSDDIVGTDLDNESETVVADLVIKLISQAERVFILIRSHDPEAPLGALGKLFQIATKQVDRISHIVLSGEHIQTEKVCASWGGKFVRTSEEDAVKDLLKTFAQ